METNNNKIMNINNKEKVAVAMSGGVDSSVCAFLLAEKGFDIYGATMRLFCTRGTKTPINDEDCKDAGQICQRLGIEHKIYNLEKEFKQYVIDNFTDTYISGATPNPCIECNKHLKFGALLNRVKSEGATHIATGHYVKTELSSNGRVLLKKAADSKKDQSYVLWGLSQNQLASSLFPLGDLTKDEIREIAFKQGFKNASKGDSQDICFIPDNDYVKFIIENTNYTPAPGNYIDTDGNIIGKHKGIINYTIGQRKGLGISMGKHIFVCDKNPADNTVTLSDEDKLFTKTIVIKNINLIPFDKIDSPIKIQAKIRYKQPQSPAIAEQTSENEITLTFDEPQRAPAKGQSAVMYDGDYVIGGGIIV